MLQLGQRLHTLRLEQGLSLAQMVWGSDFSGRGYLLEIESGRASPSLASLAKLAKVLNVDLIDLVNFPQEGLRPRLIDLTRHLDQEDLAILLQHGERLRDKEDPPR